MLRNILLLKNVLTFGAIVRLFLIFAKTKGRFFREISGLPRIRFPQRPLVCTITRLSYTIGWRFYTISRLLCTIGWRFSTIARLPCTIGWRFSTFVPAVYTLPPVDYTFAPALSKMGAALYATSAQRVPFYLLLLASLPSGLFIEEQNQSVKLMDTE